MTPDATRDVVRLGLLRCSPPGQELKGRTGQSKPFVIDSRGAGTNLALRTAIMSEMQLHLSKFDRPSVIVGMATSGIMWGSWLAWIQQLPYATARLDGPRKSGLKREVEGEITGLRAVVIDNWARTGSTIDSAADLVSNCGATIVGALVLASTHELASSIHVESLWLETDLMNAAIELGLLTTPANLQEGAS